MDQGVGSEMAAIDCDVAIVGGGAAGLNAALMLARAGRDVVVIDSGTPRNRFASHVHGYLAREGTPPGELLAIGRREIEGYGGVVREGKVTDIVTVREGEAFAVTLADGTSIRPRRVLLATGVRDVLPEIPGLSEGWGRDVLHCPYCHGYEVRNQPLGVIAMGPQGVHHGVLVRQWTHDLVYFSNGNEPSDEDRVRMEARGTRVVDGVVRRIVRTDERLTGVELEDGAVVARAAVFTLGRIDAVNPLLTRIGVAIERNEISAWVRTDGMGLTSVPGIWAAGNVADPMAQAIAAAAAGGRAGAVINMSLVEEETRVAVEALRSETTSAIL